MKQEKKRITLDLDAALHRLLKETAAQKGVSMREFCEAAFERQLAEDEAALATNDSSLPSDSQHSRDLRAAARNRHAAG